MGPGGEVWSYNGAIWSQVNTDGFGDASNIGCHSLIAFNGFLYAGTYNFASGTEIWEYNGATWTQVNSDGFGSSNNTTSQAAAIYGGALYFGTANGASGGEIWEWDGSSWRQIVSGGFGDSNNAAIASNGLADFGGFLISGTFNPNGGTVFEVDPQGAAAEGIPTLSRYGLMILVLLIVIAAVGLLRRI